LQKLVDKKLEELKDNLPESACSCGGWCVKGQDICRKCLDSYDPLQTLKRKEREKRTVLRHDWSRIQKTKIDIENLRAENEDLEQHVKRRKAAVVHELQNKEDSMSLR